MADNASAQQKSFFHGGSLGRVAEKKALDISYTEPGDLAMGEGEGGDAYGYASGGAEFLVASPHLLDDRLGGMFMEDSPRHHCGGGGLGAMSESIKDSNQDTVGE